MRCTSPRTCTTHPRPSLFTPEHRVLREPARSAPADSHNLGLMAIRRRVIAHGRVHGVGFRASVARAAQLRGVAGWARNRPDGTVEIVLEGDEQTVESVLRLCREGPRAAMVTQFETSTEQPEGLTGFEIR